MTRRPEDFREQWIALDRLKVGSSAEICQVLRSGAPLLDDFREALATVIESSTFKPTTSKRGRPRINGFTTAMREIDVQQFIDNELKVHGRGTHDSAVKAAAAKFGLERSSVERLYQLGRLSLPEPDISSN
jgi:hypothetical protein